MKKLWFIFAIFTLALTSCNNGSKGAQQTSDSVSSTDNSLEQWKTFQLPPVHVKNPYPEEAGSKLYFSIVQNPEEFIHTQCRNVLDKLYFSPTDTCIPKIEYLDYVLDNYDGISACYGGGNMKGIILSNQYVESYHREHGAQALISENQGVLTHELTHAFQLESKGCGDYGSNPVFQAWHYT